MDVQVIVTTWGHPSWAGMAERVALASTEGLDAHVYHHHEPDAASAGAARNRAVEICDPLEWICFLDADDRLEAGYLDAMRRSAHEYHYDGTVLFAPALRLDGEPKVYWGRDILDGSNPCPIGTLIHRDMFEEAGQFWGEPAWEDWSLFRRAVLVGARICFVPDAVYDASRSHGAGRNATVVNPRRLRRDIVRSHDEWLR
jgi:glycosyltransferase involved in cell wall biosynthesis